MIGNGDTFCGTLYEYYDDNWNKMFEFHVDDCPRFAEWSDWPDFDSARFGGCLSVWFPGKGAKPLIIFGQDECIFKQYVFTKKSWMGSQGQTVLTPKDEGQGVMISLFVSCDNGSNFQLSSQQLDVVNEQRKGTEYN